MPPGEGKAPPRQEPASNNGSPPARGRRTWNPNRLRQESGSPKKNGTGGHFSQSLRPELPASQLNDPRVRGPVDVLIGAVMPDGLQFSRDADKLTLLKRASFDLIGLPPSQEEIDVFLADSSPDAFERLTDQFLASPMYAERWARHWLDVAGYSDSEGGTAEDVMRPWAFKYRDYVISAFNVDMPFDRFIQEQLAGDELAAPMTGDLNPRQIEQLTATGYLRMAADGTGSGGDTPEGPTKSSPTRSRFSVRPSWGSRSLVHNVTIIATIPFCRRITSNCGRSSSRLSIIRNGKLLRHD